MVMRNHLLALLLFSVPYMNGFATDRVVSPSGTYNTISSAITASEDGDRILVASGNYTEYLTIGKSLSIMPLVEGTRYTVSNDVTLSNANGKTVLISGMRATTMRMTGTNTTLTVLQVVDSRVVDLTCQDPFTRVELYRDSLAHVSISSGSVIGCRVGADVPSGTIGITGPTSLNTEVRIIGNHMGGISKDPVISIFSNVVFRLENNYVQASYSPTVYLQRSADVTDGPSTFVNNTFYKGANTNEAIVACTGNFRHTLVVKNNAIGNYALGVISAPPALMLQIASNNMLGSPTWVTTATGEPPNGSPFINAGDPDPRYLDLDLTTNDVGCYGGSNSRANFTTPMGSAVVGFMIAPRVVAQGDAVNINAVGFDR